MTAAAIRVRDLRKRYDALEAVRGVSFEVAEGEIFGLIGPDGAGKTSIFQIVAGVMEATDGTAEVFGRPARQARSETGYLTQTFSLYPDLTVSETLRYAGDLRRVAPDAIARRGRRYLEMFDLHQFVDRRAGKLSGGMKQKLSLACALVAQPRVLLLDEPTTGVDPVSRREFWDALAHLAAEGLTVLLATPYLDEAERCHRVAFLAGGKILALDTPAHLQEAAAGALVEVVASPIRRALEIAREQAGPERVQLFGDRLHVRLDREADYAPVGHALNQAGIDVASWRVIPATLEDVFIDRLAQETHP